MNPTGHTKPLYHHYLGVLVLAIVLSFVYFYLFDFLRWIEHDTPSHILGTKLLFGIEGGENWQHRVTKPIPMLLPGIGMLLGIHPTAVFLFQNTLLFYACTLSAFHFGYTLLNSRAGGWYASLMLLGSQVFAIYPLFITSDAWGYLFILLIGIQVVKISRTRENKPYRWYVFMSIFLVVGLLSKESVLFGCLWLILVLSLLSKRHRLGAILMISVTMVLTVGIQYIIQANWGGALFFRIAETQDFQIRYNLSLNYFLQQLHAIDNLIWLVVAGMLVGFKHHRREPAYQATILSLAFFLLLAPLLPLYNYDRILFMAFPAILLLACYGIEALHIRGVLYLLLIGMSQVIVSWLIYRWDIKGILPILWTGGGLLLLLMLWLDRKQPIQHRSLQQ